MAKRFVENVFYAFRGSADSVESRRHQLEDNLTKALVNTLFHTQGVVTRALLAALDVETTATGDVFAYAMQATRPPRLGGRAHRTRVLLGIVSPRAADEPTTGTRPAITDRGRPDAWICGPDVTVLVESKIGDGQLDDAQMRRHLALLESLDTEASPPPRVVVTTWAKVYDVIHQLLRSDSVLLGDRGAWLARQLMDYLEITNMSGFTGFKPELFDYFYEPADDGQRSEDLRIVVRDAFGEFAELLRARLHLEHPFYETVDAGKLTRTTRYAWAALGPAQNLRERAHLTLTLDATGLTLQANLETKPVIERLRRALRRDAQRLRKIIGALAADERGADGRPADPDVLQRFSVVVEERKQLQVQKYLYYPRATYDVNALSDGPLGDATVGLLSKMVEHIELPYLAVRTHLDRTLVESLSTDERGAPLVARLVTLASQLHPVVEYVNAG